MADELLPMPPESRFGPVETPARYFFFIYDTMDVPQEMEFGSFVVLTPTFEKLAIYGRVVGSPFPEDAVAFRRMQMYGRVMGEWFSVACPDGELGTNALADLTEISAEAFSAAYQRGWTFDG